MKKTRCFVAYQQDEEGLLCYLLIPEEEVHHDVEETDEREEFFEDLRYEGAIAGRVIDGSGKVDDRMFEPQEGLPLVYMITSTVYEGEPPYVATLEELQGMFPLAEFVELGSGVGVVASDGVLELVGLNVREYRERVGGCRVSVPVVEDGEGVPIDRTYVYVSKRRRILRHEPGSECRLRVCERSRDIIPYVDGKPLWSSVLIDWFIIEVGEAGAIEAAREAIGQARGVWKYDGVEHYGRLVG